MKNGPSEPLGCKLRQPFGLLSSGYGLCFFWPVKTNVYIDGFNLYYGCLRGTPYRWLNVRELCRALLPNHTIQRVKYFTARVSARPNDPGQPTRQQTYLGALCTLDDVEIIYGHFLTSEELGLVQKSPQKV